MYRDCRHGWLLCLLCSMVTVYNVHSFTVRNVEDVQSTTVQQESHHRYVDRTWSKDNVLLYYLKKSMFIHKQAVQ